MICAGVLILTFPVPLPHFLMAVLTGSSHTARGEAPRGGDPRTREAAPGGSGVDGSSPGRGLLGIDVQNFRCGVGCLRTLFDCDCCRCSCSGNNSRRCNSRQRESVFIDGWLVNKGLRQGGIEETGNAEELEN